MKHFEFTGESKEHFGDIFYRIRCTRPLWNVMPGDIGGWIQSESNIEGRGWVGGEAMVSGESVIGDEAMVKGNTIVRNSRVGGIAILACSAQIYNNSIVRGNVLVNHGVYNNALIEKEDDYCVLYNVGEGFDRITAYRNRNNEIWIETIDREMNLESFERYAREGIISWIDRPEFDPNHIRRCTALVELFKIQFNVKEPSKQAP